MPGIIVRQVGLLPHHREPYDIRATYRQFMGERSWATNAATRRAMQGNRSRDTKPELLLRRQLHAMGLRYRVCTRPIPEVRHRADIVFRPARVAVEVRGCFWHGCPAHHRAPAANSEYWRKKVERNMARDRETETRLADAGWTVVVVWEHEPVEAAAARIAAEVRLRRKGG